MFFNEQFIFNLLRLRVCLIYFLVENVYNIVAGYDIAMWIIIRWFVGSNQTIPPVISN